VKRKDWLLTLLLISVWGANFTVVKIGSGSMPPMLLAAARYILVAFPAVFFVKKPALEWYYTLAYGMTIGVGQFACLYYAMYIGMPAGLASLVLQSQSFISILLAAIFLKESFKSRQVVGLTVAVSGLFMVGLALGPVGGRVIPVAALVLTVLAATFWSIANLIVKSVSNRAKERGVPLDTFSMVVWSGLVPPLPFLVLSYLLDGPGAIMIALNDLNLVSFLGILYTAWGATLLGAGIWSHLIARYSMGNVAPLTMLVPVAGMLVARLILKERLSAEQWIGSLAIVLGLAIFNFGVSPLKKLSIRRILDR
jgi:O-acetylserine/cysteine efflux transporter